MPDHPRRYRAGYLAAIIRRSPLVPHSDLPACRELRTVQELLGHAYPHTTASHAAYSCAVPLRRVTLAQYLARIGDRRRTEVALGRGSRQRNQRVSIDRHNRLTDLAEKCQLTINIRINQI